MTARSGQPGKILAVVDTSRMQIALESALLLAEAHGAGLEVIACVDPPGDLSILSRLSGAPSGRLIEDVVEQARTTIRARLAEIAPHRPLDLSVSIGKSYLEIIRHVARSDCDLVVKKAEPLSGFDRFLFSSNDQHLLRKCPCPVWLQTPKASRSPGRILAAVDLDLDDAAEPGTLAALNRRVLDAACMIARAPDAEVIVLHAWEAIGEGMMWAFSAERNPRASADRYVNEILDARHRAMSRLIEDFRNETGSRLALFPRLRRGSPETVIPEESRKEAADLVVMGTVARTGLGGVFIGNTAENILNGLECPVLAVKPVDFASPLLRG